MAYKVIILYQLYMPSYFLGTFTEYPYRIYIQSIIIPETFPKLFVRKNSLYHSRTNFQFYR